MNFSYDDFLVQTPLPMTEFLRNYLDESLFDPLIEFLQRPQKGIRSQIVELGFYLASPQMKPTDIELSQRLCEILEGVHAGSLIVDDIQDGSLVRRGAPSLHHLHGIPKALNAGNWLYFWALKNICELNVSAELKLKILHLFQSALLQGHLGQALDVGRPVTQVPLTEIPDLCFTAMNLKTGSLVGLALSAGALLGGMTEPKAAQLNELGYEFGYLLQILDDLKNLKIAPQIGGDPKNLEDLKNLRPSFIWAFAAKNFSHSQFKGLVDATVDLPDPHKLQAWMSENNFIELAFAEVERRKRRIDELTISFCHDLPHRSNALDKIHFLIQKLEEAYEQA